MEIKVGCDPELFLQNEKGEFISAHGMVPGTKHDPMHVSCGALQIDGTAVEFNIDPAGNLREFTKNIETVLDYAEYFVEARNYRQEEGELKLVFEPTANYTKEHFESIPEDAKELGCDPDFNAYTGEANERPNAKVMFRTGAGHIHVGWTADQDINDPNHIDACHTLVKQLDHCLFPVSKLWDNDDRRRELYGKIGAFRPKPYGVEWRVLSNKWVGDPRLRIYVYLCVVKAVELLVEKTKLFEDDPYCSRFTRRCSGTDPESKGPPTRAEIWAYSQYLNENYDFPKLPASYRNE